MSDARAASYVYEMKPVKFKIVDSIDTETPRTYTRL